MKRLFVLFFILVLSFPLVSEDQRDGSLYLGSKAPYPEPGRISYSEPPAGYEPAFIYSLNRHGSRNLSGFKYDKAWMDMLDEADSRGGLTEEGEILRDEIRRIAAHEEGRYGLLTELGKNELHDIGFRLEKNFQDLFSGDARILADATYKERTHESRASFLTGMKEAGFSGEVELLDYEEDEDPYLRPFDSAERYDEYADDGDWQKDLEEFMETDEAYEMALRVCSQFLTDDFMEDLKSGKMEFYDVKGKTRINSPGTAVSCLYELYIILPALKEDGFETPDLGKYFLEKELKMFEVVQNAESFFESGPGKPESEDIALNIMAPSTKRILAEMELFLNNSSSYTGIFSFGHAETLVPMVGFWEIEGADTAFDDIEEAAKHWKAGYYGPMGGNLQFVLYTSDEGEPLVKVLLHERESSFAEELTPVSGPYYKWSDIKDYYERKVNGLGVYLEDDFSDDLTNLKTNF